MLLVDAVRCSVKTVQLFMEQWKVIAGRGENACQGEKRSLEGARTLSTDGPREASPFPSTNPSFY
jgi:hypothetical protein